jgi:hypothetical protein
METKEIKMVDLTKPYFYEGNDDLPYIKLDRTENKFLIKGRSLPEDVLEFYSPVIDWFSYYSISPNENTVFEVRLEYMNSGSSKMIFSLLQKLQEIHFKGYKVLIKWYYPSEDEDMRDEGKNFAERLDLPIELIKMED